MKPILITLTLIVAAFTVKAQKVDTIKGISADTAIFSKVEKDPSFPGGDNKFYRFLQKTIRYPSDSFKKRIQGKVFLTMVIEKDGTVTNVRVAKGVADDIDAEAVRVVKLSPKWHPAYQGGKPVRVYYTIPITFGIQGN